jgi:hypothetical protein
LRREVVGKHVKVPAECLGDNRPARRLMIADGQFKPEYLIEVNAVVATA